MEGGRAVGVQTGKIGKKREAIISEQQIEVTNLTMRTHYFWIIIDLKLI